MAPPCDATLRRREFVQVGAGDGEREREREREVVREGGGFNVHSLHKVCRGIRYVVCIYTYISGERIET